LKGKYEEKATVYSTLRGKKVEGAPQKAENK
jgi:hypothetical protein